MIVTLVLADAFRAQIVAEAFAAFPGECCGLIEGVCDSGTARAVAIHPARNIAAGSNHFEIDPAAHFALLRRLRGTGRAIIGCYHSHPDGRAEPSARDAAGAFEEGFLWLIAATTGGKAGEFGAFRRDLAGFARLHLVAHA